MCLVDLVGDIHGQSDELEKLLTKMGYTPFGNGYRHSERTLIMVGDLIDGTSSVSGQRRVIEIAQSMVHHGDAQIVMGNHEFNAICYATKMDSNHYVRLHSEKNQRQHQVFLEAFPFGTEPYWQAIEFFKTMPLWIETPNYRVVHACWNDAAMKRLASELDTQNCFYAESFFQRFGAEEQPLFDDIELILKGPEVPLPDGISFQDKYGHTRTRSRVRWWNDSEVLFQGIEAEIGFQDRNNVSEIYHLASSYCYQSAVPVFFGHYWIPPEDFNHELQNAPAVCLDYSVGRKGGQLMAIRLNESLDKSEWFSVVRYH